MSDSTTTTRLSRDAVERAATAEGMFISANKPDMVAAYMRTLAQDALAYMTALEQIRDTMGRVCEDFEICGHVACADSCGAVLVALGALNGDPLS